jgi:hypothetical protein
MLLFAPSALAAEKELPENPGESSESRIIEKEYEFTSQTEAFSYNAPETAVQDGETYLRKDIRYELMETIPIMAPETKLFEETREKTGLKKKDDGAFPESLPIDTDGYKGEIPRVKIEYAEQKQPGDSKTHTAALDYGAQVLKPTPPDSLDQVIEGKKLTLKLTELKQSNERWEPNFTAYLNCGPNDLPSLETPNPAYQGYESALLPLMRLDPAQYVIRSATWAESGGGAKRMALFEVSRCVSDYSAIYELVVITPDVITYDARAAYEGELAKEVQTGEDYRVKAIVTYEAPAKPTAEPTATPESTPEPIPEPVPEPAGFPVLPVVMGGGVVVIAGVLLFLKKRKKEK